MVLITNQIEQEKEYYTPTNDDYIGCTLEDYYMAKSPFTMIQKMLILMVISHDFVKSNNAEFSAQLVQFSESVNGLSGPTELGIKYRYSTDELLAIKNDAAYYKYWNDKHHVGATYSEAWTEKGDQIRKGTGTSVMAWPMGDPLTAPVPPADVPPGAEKRFRDMAAFAKSQKAVYLVGDGIIMGIEVNSTPFVPGAGKPDLTVELSGGGHPLLAATKSKYTGFNIYKNSNDGKGFVFLYKCNDPSCSDMSALPASGVSAAWIYKANYVFDGNEVGTMSDPVTVTVIGTV